MASNQLVSSVCTWVSLSQIHGEMIGPPKTTELAAGVEGDVGSVVLTQPGAGETLSQPDASRLMSPSTHAEELVSTQPGASKTLLQPDALRLMSPSTRAEELWGWNTLGRVVWQRCGV
jgi:hypothetical protein